jgi:hypothetical protein
MFKISIPKPCFEGWENMTVNEQGRHCNACAKTVVDFSVMSDGAVQQYFIANSEKQICGRFKNTQVQSITIDLPNNIFRLQLPFWKKFLVAFLICFGESFFSIDTTMAGNTFSQGNVIYKSNYNINDIKIPKKKYKKRKNKITRIKLIDFGPLVMGMINIYPTPPIIKNCFPRDIRIEKAEPSIFDPPNYTKEKKDTNTGTTVKNNTAANNSSKEPVPETPEQSSIAFVLPAVLIFKNPFGKKKKA